MTLTAMARTAVSGFRKHRPQRVARFHLEDAHHNLGVTLAERGDIAGAARLFAAALKIDPSDAGAKANLQRALRMLKEERREA